MHKPLEAGVKKLVYDARLQIFQIILISFMNVPSFLQDRWSAKKLA
jgi:hypothetical protein